MEPEKKESGKGGPEGQLAVRAVFWRRSGSPPGLPRRSGQTNGAGVGGCGAGAGLGIQGLGGGDGGARGGGYRVWAQPPAPFLRVRRAPHTAILVSAWEARMRAARGYLVGESEAAALVTTWGQAPPTVLLVQCWKALGCSEWAPYFFPCSVLTCCVCFESYFPSGYGGTTCTAAQDPAGDSDAKESAYSARDLGSVPGWGRFPDGGHGNPLLAWRIPWKEEPGRLQPMGLHRVGHDCATNTINTILVLGLCTCCLE